MKWFREFIEGLGGRKFIVFVTCSYLVLGKSLHSDHYMWIAICYMFANLLEQTIQKNDTAILGLFGGRKIGGLNHDRNNGDVATEKRNPGETDQR